MTSRMRIARWFTMSDIQANVDNIDPDHFFVDRLFVLHPPKNELVADVMDKVRAIHSDLAHYIVEHVPRTADRTIALRSLHRACMDTIAAIACNQEGYPDVE